MRRKYSSPEKTAWAASLPDSYYREMAPAIEELTRGWFSATDIAEGYDVYLRDCYLYGRMDQCHSWVMPRHQFYGTHGAEWEACLTKVLQGLDPPIDRAFAAPSLDLILRSTQ
jgi:hypothetical protein